MKSVEFLENESWAKVGAGHTLGSLYEALEARNLSFVGGRTADVGVGGYLLGGGLSNWSPKYGLAVDNILAYEVFEGRMRCRGEYLLNNTGCSVELYDCHDQRALAPGSLLYSPRRHEQLLYCDTLHHQSLPARPNLLWDSHPSSRSKRSCCQGGLRADDHMET